MNKILYIAIFIVIAISAQAQSVGINATGAIPHSSSILDMNTGNTYTSPNGKGILPPNVPLTGITDAVTVTSPATSLLVYNTATANTGTLAVVPGYYYWNGTQWVALGGSDWHTLGNIGTTAGTNFLGTTDAQDMVFKTNNIENMRITNSNGNVGIGIATPSAKLHVRAGDILAEDGVYPQASYSVGYSGSTVISDIFQPWTDNGIKFYDGNSNSHIHMEAIGQCFIQAYGTGGAPKSSLENTAYSNLGLQTGGGSVGIGTLSPDNSALLDVTTTNKGFLMPRIALLSNTDVVTIPSPATGLQVYNTNYTSTLSTGICYFDGTYWLNVSTYAPAGYNFFTQQAAFSVPNNGTLVTIPFGTITAPQSGIYSGNLRMFTTSQPGPTTMADPNETAFYFQVRVNGVLQDNVEYYTYNSLHIATSVTLRYTANAGDVITFGYTIGAGYNLNFTNPTFFNRNNVVISKIQ